MTEPDPSLTEPPVGSQLPVDLATLSSWVTAARQQTPARIFTGHAGPAYRTRTQLELRADHAWALDSVHAELELERDFGEQFVADWNLFAVRSCAGSKAQYLMRPDLGRRFPLTARELIQRRCPRGADLQIVIGDGLSCHAVIQQVPRLLPGLISGALERGWRVGQVFVVEYCRVGILNDIGDLLDSQVTLLLIGERPGLATSESLSAYFAFRPKPGHNDAQRNVISNIHARGLPPDQAIHRILAFAEKLQQVGHSGFDVKEEQPVITGSALSFPEPPAESQP